jgi:glycosyltransferase involved in cell wall biosynthesis
VKVAWLSNRPDANSGYGTQTRQVARRMLADGHALEFLTNDGTRQDYEWEGCPVRASGMRQYSQDTVRRDLEDSGADWLVSLYDAWVYTGRDDPFAGLANVAGWMPVDCNPVPPTVIPWARTHRVIAMSQYGRDQLEGLSAAIDEAGTPGFPVMYAPHAVDRSLYRPVDGRAFRDEHGVPRDAFLVGVVAANTGTKFYDRKGFGDMLTALGMFMRDYPEAHAYLHTHPTGYEAMDLRVLATVVSVDPARLHWADEYRYVKGRYSDADMAAAYSAFDVLLFPSRGEGFGVPAIESLACGTPVIASNWTAQAEVIDHPYDARRPGFVRTAHGWLVQVALDYDPHQAAFRGKPDIGEVLQALREAHAVWSDPDLSRDVSAACVERSALWDADRVYADRWRPILAELASMPAADPEPVPVNRAARRQLERARKSA